MNPTRAGSAREAGYTAAKHALAGWTDVLAVDLYGTGVRVHLVNPGPTRTSMRAQAFPGEDANALPPPEHVCETMVRLAEPSFTGNGLSVPIDRPRTVSN